MRVAILWVALLLGAAAAAAQPADPRVWTGGDFMRAPVDARMGWLVAVVGLWAPRLEPAKRVVVAVRVSTCLNEMMTPRKRGEQMAVAAFQASPLGELAALCALHIPEITEAAGR